MGHFEHEVDLAVGGPSSCPLQQGGGDVAPAEGRCYEQAADLGWRGCWVLADLRQRGDAVCRDVSDDADTVGLSDPCVQNVRRAEPPARVGWPVQRVVIEAMDLGEQFDAPLQVIWLPVADRHRVHVLIMTQWACGEGRGRCWR